MKYKVKMEVNFYVDLPENADISSVDIELGDVSYLNSKTDEYEYLEADKYDISDTTLLNIKEVE